uniref:Ig-like domain-containing protein n=1 Tax=Romanomermis culicivorax TaxID=13658 RepID=A0A915K1X4_ROMCU
MTQFQLTARQTCHLECHVRPTDDPSLNVQWYKDGQLLQASHRFKHVQNFGYVAFDFLQVYPEDSGRYSCVASNEIGSAETYCSIKCYPLANLYLDTEHPESLRRIQILEQSGQKPSQESEPPKIAPRFVQELTGPEGYLTEGQTVHLQCRYEPNSDPSLKLEWLFNNQPMIHGSRFRTVNDFGYVSLDILNVIPEDTGLYTVKIVNDLGEAATNFDMECRSIKSLYLDPQNEQSLRQIRSRFQTKFDFDTVSLKILTTYPEDSGVYSCKATNNAGECAVSCLIKCKATRSILSETQNEESLHRIHDLENRTRPKPVEPEIEICPPKFIVPLGPNFTLNEGESVHLECNLVPKNDPNISIQW